MHGKIAWTPPCVCSLVVVRALLLLRAICLATLIGTLPHPAVRYAVEKQNACYLLCVHVCMYAACSFVWVDICEHVFSGYLFTIAARKLTVGRAAGPGACSRTLCCLFTCCLFTCCLLFTGCLFTSCLDESKVQLMLSCG